MNIYQGLEELQRHADGFGLALGVFDGLHLGHQAVIDAARGEGSCGVLTFDPHPVQVLAPDRAPRRILSNLEHKAKLLADLGLDFMAVIEFSSDFAAMEARKFADQLFKTGVKRLSAGQDWSFGKDRGGNMSRLAEWGREAGVEVISVAPVTLASQRISSTLIREALQEENLEAAARMLGRPYSVFGQVVQGRQLGRTIGFPTANVAVVEEVLPPNGVYLVEGNGTRGVANIGTRPTVDSSARRSLEVHLFTDDLPMTYGWDLEVSFLAKIRDEKKFASLEELKAQISRDVNAAKTS